MYKVFRELMDKRQDWDQEQLERIIIDCLDDMNFHTFNYLLIAYLFGTYEEIEKAAEIMLEHERAGKALPHNMEWQKKLRCKYLFKEAANE